MKTLYLDPFSGISGNMFIGLCIDLGGRYEGFLAGLAPLGLKKEDFILERREIKGISATYFNMVGEEEKLTSQKGGHHHKDEHDHDEYHQQEGERAPHAHHHHHRSLADVLALIDATKFSPSVKERAGAIFTTLAEGESTIHNQPIEAIHFHEVGEMDSIVDVLGAAYFLENLAIDRIFSAKINTGYGMVDCAHGTYPIPAPATLAILSGTDLIMGGIPVEGELTTPTGAAILATICSGYVPTITGNIHQTGYGAGSKDFPIPNVLRGMIVLDEREESPLWFSFNVDDMTGEELGFFMEKLFSLGARDVTFTPIFMKKNRPGHRIDILTDTAHEEAVIEAIFRHSTTLGFKQILMEKTEFSREMVRSPRGFSMKQANYKKEGKSSFEYEEMRKEALLEDMSLREVYNRFQREEKPRGH